MLVAKGNLVENKTMPTEPAMTKRYEAVRMSVRSFHPPPFTEPPQPGSPARLRYQLDSMQCLVRCVLRFAASLSAGLG